MPRFRLALLLFSAIALFLCLPGALVAQPLPLFKDATTNPCAFDSGLGRSARCATAGQDVAWSLTSTNGTGSDQIVSIVDGPPVPAGCMAFVCPPELFIQGNPVPLPMGSTCDPATGFNIPGVAWRSFTDLEVRFHALLSAGLANGDTCDNAAQIKYNFGNMDSGDPSVNCRTAFPAPTELTICAPTGPPPDFLVVKSILDAAGTALTEVHDNDAVCFQMDVVNTGTASGTFEFSDGFGPRITGAVIDPSVNFDTGNCSINGSTLNCFGVTLGAGIPDAIRVCGTYDCDPATTSLCNSALLHPTAPTGNDFPSRPCPACPVGPACVPVVMPNFDSSTLQGTLEDKNGNTCADAGDAVLYEVSVVNSTSAPAVNSTFFSPATAGSVYAGDCTWSTGGGPFVACPGPPDSSFSLGTLLQGDPPVVVKWHVNLTTPDPAQPFCNREVLIHTDACSTSKFLTGGCVGTCGAPAALSVTKSSTPVSDLPVGSVFRYDVTVCNTGANPASGVVIDDPIPATCTGYSADSLKMHLQAQADTPMTDAADADAADYDPNAPPSVHFDVQKFLGRDLASGECVVASFSVTITGCAGQVFTNVATASGTGIPPVDSQPWYFAVKDLAPIPVLTKSVTPSGTVQPGQVLTYDLSLCNDARATDSIRNALMDDFLLESCMKIVSGSLVYQSAPMTDPADADAGEIVIAPPAFDKVQFHAGNLAPGECRAAQFQATAGSACSGRVLVNSFSLTSDNVSAGSNTTSTPVAGVSFDKTATDSTGAPLYPTDTLWYEAQLCNNSVDTLMTFHMEDPIPGAGSPPPASDCESVYVPGSLEYAIFGNAYQTATDAVGDDVGQYVAGPPARVELDLPSIIPGECAKIRFRVTVSRSCDSAECLRNVAHATYDQNGPVTKDSVASVVCIGPTGPGELYRNLGVGSLTATGGCQFGDRLSQFACSAIPATCSPAFQGQEWTLAGDAQTGGAPLVFYEVHSDGCCDRSPSDGKFIRVNKTPGGNDVTVWLDWRCP